MSDAMRATKTEPVLQWQTKEELQRGKKEIEEERGGCSAEDDRRGRRRTGDVQVDAEAVDITASVRDLPTVKVITIMIMIIMIIVKILTIVKL